MAEDSNYPDERVIAKLRRLEEKYDQLGQDLHSYLDGLYHSKGLDYWEYIHLDSLLGLQTPRTAYKDEVIFIVYHQMTELYFKLVKQEIELLTDPAEEEYQEPANWIKRIERCNTYFRHLCESFDIMVSGIDRDEMRKFRIALLPASGFQSVQFRQIELMSSDLRKLADESQLSEDASLEAIFELLYWKQGGKKVKTQKKTITLIAFEEKYDESLITLAHSYRDRNLLASWNKAPKSVRSDEKVTALLRSYDQHINVFWKLSHLSAASRHLIYGEKALPSTGGTNWRKFLPPKYQRILFFPELWSEGERNDWGKAAVMHAFSRDAKP